MRTLRNWTLGAKLFLVATPFLLIALCSIGALVWMFLQLEGGAASECESFSDVAERRVQRRPI